MGLIKKPHELIIPKRTVCLIYGPPGIGKTTIGFSAPAPVLLDFDGGVHRVEPVHLGDTVQVSSWDDVLNFFKEDLSEYLTIVIDTASKMLDFMTIDIIKNNSKMSYRGGLNLQGYGERKKRFKNFVNQIKQMGKHVVFIAQEEEDKDGDVKFLRPMIGGSSAKDLLQDIDIVGFVETKGPDRLISFSPNSQYYGKNSCGFQDEVLLRKPGYDNNDFLTGVFEVHADFIANREKLIVKFNDLIEEIKDEIDSIENADMANQFVESIDTYEHLWNSKRFASQYLKAHANAMGLSFSKKERIFFDAGHTQTNIPCFAGKNG